MLIVFLLYFLCACTFTLSKATLAYTTPLFYAAVRMALSGLLLLGISLVQKKSLRIHREDIFLWLQLILAHIVLPYGLELWALTRVTSIESSLIFSLSPFIAAAISYVGFGEVLSKKKWLGLGIGSLALIPLLGQAYHCGALAFSGQVLPLLAICGAVFSSTYAWILVQQLIKCRSYSTFVVNGYAMLGGSALLGVGYVAFGEYLHTPAVSSWSNFTLLLVAMIVVSNIFYTLYGNLLKRYSATFLSFAGFLTPLMVSVLGYFTLGECMSWSLGLSTALVLVGLGLFYSEELKGAPRICKH